MSVTTSRDASRDTHPVLAELADLLDPRSLVTDPDLLASYRQDAAAVCESHLPRAAVLPASEAEVQEVLRAAGRHRVPVVPQGALTGLAGGANAVPGCLVLSTRRLNRILEVDADNQIAVVEPGVTNGALRTAAEEVGLTYRPDPSSWESATIGGNIATDAGGLCCVKYGVTSRFVRGLRVVLPDGRAVALGRRTVKGVAGLDLTALFVGSEGTLGVITQATVALDPVSAEPLTLAATFPDAATAGRACARILADSIKPSLLEVIDRVTLTAVNRYARLGLDGSAGALVIAQTDVGRGAREELDRMAELCTEAGASEVVPADDLQESELLVQARRLAYPALESQGPTLVDDVAVPLTELGRMIDEVGRIAQRHDLVIGCVGHAGDGNLHPTVVIDPADPSSLERGRVAFEEIAEFALGLGGTITGEHGVGLLKRELLERELDPVALELQRSVKELVDPLCLLNPGKVIAPYTARERAEVAR